MALLPLSSLLGCVLVAVGALMVCGQRFQSLIRQPLNWGLGLLGLWLLFLAFLSDRPNEALLGLFNFLPFFLVFAALSLLIQTPGQLRRLSWTIVLGSVPVVVMGLGEYFFGWVARVRVLWIVLDWTLHPTGNPPGRMASVFDYANVLASYLVVVFILAIALGLELAPWRGSHGERLPQRKWQFRPAWWLLCGIVGTSGLGLGLTHSRNAWAIAGLACLAFAVYEGWRWLMGLVGTVAGGILWSAFGPDPVRQWLRRIVPFGIWGRLTDDLHPDRPVVMLRSTQWQFTLTLTQQRPWTGWGLRTFTPLYQERMNFWLGHPHNLPLMLFAETGIPATLLFLGLVGWVVARGTQRLMAWAGGTDDADRRIFYSYLTAFLSCTLFHLFDITLFDARINFLGWLLLAGIWGVTQQKASSPAQ